MLNRSPYLDEPFVGEHVARLERDARLALEGLVWPHEITDRTWDGRRKLLVITRTAIECRRQAPDWAYHLNGSNQKTKALVDLRKRLEAELLRLTGLDDVRSAR